MIITELYSKYKIMPQLAAHQLRVAATAKIICDSFRIDLHVHEVVSACLLHDMGNILKFDLSYFPEFVEPEGLVYWEGIKKEFAKRYGADEHAATLAIAKEIGVSALTYEYIEAVGFRNIRRNQEDPSFEKRICGYADMRVGPRGVLSLEGRFAEGKARYANRYPSERDAEEFKIKSEGWKAIERQIFKNTSITADAVNDITIEKYFSTLKNFEVA